MHDQGVMREAMCYKCKKKRDFAKACRGVATSASVIPDDHATLVL